MLQKMNPVFPHDLSPNYCLTDLFIIKRYSSIYSVVRLLTESPDLLSFECQLVLGRLICVIDNFG